MSRPAATTGDGAGKPAGAAEAPAAAAGTRPGVAGATVPVTGGTGFLGASPVRRQLVSAEHRGLRTIRNSRDRNCSANTGYKCAI